MTTDQMDLFTENQALRREVARLADLQRLLLPAKAQLELRAEARRREDPLPCPFCNCGGLGMVGIGSDECFFACDASEQDLHCSVAPSTDTKAEADALADWNHRPFEDQISALLLQAIGLIQVGPEPEAVSLAILEGKA